MSKIQSTELKVSTKSKGEKERNVKYNNECGSFEKNKALENSSARLNFILTLVLERAREGDRERERGKEGQHFYLMAFGIHFTRCSN